MMYDDDDGDDDDDDDDDDVTPSDGERMLKMVVMI